MTKERLQEKFDRGLTGSGFLAEDRPHMNEYLSSFHEEENAQVFSCGEALQSPHSCHVTDNDGPFLKNDHSEI